MHISNLRYALAGAAALFAAQPSCAHAQIWIGLVVGDMVARENAAAAEAACMNGTPMIASEVVEARQPAIETMRGYFADARAGASFAGRFHLDKRTRWSFGGAHADMAGLAMQRDPFAGAGGALAAEPLGFARAGDGRSALLQWRVEGAAGAPIGTYTGLYARKAGLWRLSQLTLTSASAYAAPVVQYCHAPGDVMPYRLASTKYLRELAEKRFAKAEAKSKSAEGKAARGNAEARARAEQLAKLRDQRNNELALAKATEAKAIADAKAAEDARAAAIAALPAPARP